MLLVNDFSDINWNALSDDNIALQIGEFVKYHRLQQNSTQDKLAKDAGISRSTLSLLEKGEAGTVATLIRTLRVLDQLHVFNGFTIVQQPSPLMLAKAEKGKRQRVMPSKKEKESNNEDLDW